MAKKTDNRKHCYTFLLYTDSMSDNAFDQLDDLRVPSCVSPIHDSCVKSDGTPKKDHYHVILDFGRSKYSWNVVNDMVTPFGGVMAPVKKNGDCESYVKDKRAMTRYLCHLDNPEKAQYNPAAIRAFNGYNVGKYLKDGEDNMDSVVTDIVRYCKSCGIFSFSRLVDYAVEYEPTWLNPIMKRPYFFKQYLDGNYVTNMIINHAGDPNFECYDEFGNERIEHK